MDELDVLKLVVMYCTMGSSEKTRQTTADMFGSSLYSRWLLPGADLWHTEQQAAILLLLNSLLVCKPTLQLHSTTWCRHCSSKKVIWFGFISCIHQLQFYYHPITFLLLPISSINQSLAVVEPEVAPYSWTHVSCGLEWNLSTIVWNIVYGLLFLNFLK